ncbi:MAG: PepSY-like domain-containing protein [Bacteroidetes bacterium]|nr:PepSY-like domain-containing protein [Bacteroidota bacterium]
MKKMSILSFIVGMISFSACAQKLNESQLPAKVKSAFDQKHPGVNAKWDKENTNYEASFKMNKYDMSELYDVNGNLQETEIDIKVSELPTSIMNYIHKQYAGEKVKEAAKITKANGEIMYEAEVKGMDVLFDENGNFLKEIKDED